MVAPPRHRPCCLTSKRHGVSQWAEGRPRLTSDAGIAFITATTRPARLGRPFTDWSVRKLADHLARHSDRRVVIGRQSPAPAPAPKRRHLPAHPHLEDLQRSGLRRQAGPDRGGHQPFRQPVLRLRSVRAVIDPARPRAGWAERGKPGRLPATYTRTHGVRYFHGCYSLGDDTLWGVTRRGKSGANTLAALKSIRAARPDGAPICVILDNLSANKTPATRACAAKNKVELCFTPTYAS